MRRLVVGVVLAGLVATLLAACATTGTTRSVPAPEPATPGGKY